MSLRQVLEAQRSLRLRPGLGEQDLQELQGTLPGPLSSNLENLLRFASGFHSNALDIVDFTGRSHPFEFKEFLPYGIAVAKTVEGNFWVVDLKENGTWGEVFYISHDPPVFALHFNSLHSFLEGAVRGDSIIKEAASLISHDYLRGELAKEGRRSADKKLAQFAHALPDSFRIYDLRGLQPPQAFEWASAGPWTRCKRCQFDLIFAVE